MCAGVGSSSRVSLEHHLRQASRVDPDRTEDRTEDRSIIVAAFGSRVFGLNAHTGQVLWKQSAPSSFVLELAIAAGRVFVCSGEKLHCFDQRTGAELGAVDIPRPRFVEGRPHMLVEGERLYIGTAGTLSCFDLDGRLLWSEGFRGEGTERMAMGFPGNVRQADDRGPQ